MPSFWRATKLQAAAERERSRGYRVDYERERDRADQLVATPRSNQRRARWRAAKGRCGYHPIASLVAMAEGWVNP
jgi:hypothetical protein